MTRLFAPKMTISSANRDEPKVRGREARWRSEGGEHGGARRSTASSTLINPHAARRAAQLAQPALLHRTAEFRHGEPGVPRRGYCGALATLGQPPNAR